MMSETMGAEILIGGSRYFLAEAIAQQVFGLPWHHLHSRFPILRRPQHWQEIGGARVPHLTLDGLRQLHESAGQVPGAAQQQAILGQMLGLPPAPPKPAPRKPKTVEQEIDALEARRIEIRNELIPVNDAIRAAGMKMTEGRGRLKSDQMLPAHRRRDELRTEEQNIIVQLGKLRRQIVSQASAQNPTRERAFINAAKELLPGALYLEIWKRVEEAEAITNTEKTA